MKRIYKYLMFAGLALILILSMFYYHTEVFRFIAPKPFEGEFIYNPYQGIGGDYLKANFHAHSLAWGGLTNGHQSPFEVIDFYQQKGYDIACISNYQQIFKHYPQEKNHIRVYEHGYNIKKIHQIVFNAPGVKFIDFPLFQTRDHKQQIIKKLKQNGGLVSLAHPGLLNGYTLEDMKYLRGYDFIEVLNGNRVFTEHWDAALTAGNLVWLTAGDDTHDIEKDNSVFRAWNMIANKEAIPVLNVMKQGAFYGVKGKNANDENFLLASETDSCTFFFILKHKADKVKLIRQGGETVRELTDTDFFSYSFQPEDRYIRAEIVTNGSTIFLNPLVRSQSNEKINFYAKFPEMDIVKTVLVRISILFFHLFLMVIIVLVFNPVPRFSKR